MRLRAILLLTFCVLAQGLCCDGRFATADDPQSLSGQLDPILACLSGERDSFSLTAEITIPIDGRPQKVDAEFVRYDKQQFDLSLRHSDYALQVRRRSDATALVLPLHNTVFVGSGDVHPIDNLSLHDASARLVSSGSIASMYVSMIEPTNKAALAAIATKLLKLQYVPERDLWRGSDECSLQFTDNGHEIRFEDGSVEVRLRIGETPHDADSLSWPGMKRIELTRHEIERQLARGLRRTLEILAPAPMLTSPAQRNRTVPHGELRWVGGQRLALLSGTPQQIGRAHGELLGQECARCIDSVLYAFGTVQTIRTGRWFRQELKEAYQRLAPHIPEDHTTETRSLASSLAMDQRLIETLNVFPELFHCSGFAVFGKATKGGKLYHGRVLDYMTTIGLQDAATTFIVAVDGKIPFANVGYAGFIGSVTGMNARAISLGEMGGGGEGQWDGVPMATLMRRALEECSTLDEVKELWQSSPRTCEYYYVFADGKTNQAVGVAAVPELIEFIEPGQSDERLGTGIEDAVVLSAGDRLQTLRQRVTSRYGEIDAEIGKWLMSRPVAMQSNLHNALFVPADGVFYVAVADHKRPAAECNYVRYDLGELLNSMQTATPVAALAK
jgi:hypothetical protein